MAGNVGLLSRLSTIEETLTRRRRIDPTELKLAVQDAARAPVKFLSELRLRASAVSLASALKLAPRGAFVLWLCTGRKELFDPAAWFPGVVAATFASNQV